MIIPEPKHLFEDCLPKLEEGEEEIFYQHPEYDIKCNQIGILYPGESLTYFSYSVLSDKCNLNDLKSYKTSCPRLKLIAQCFAGDQKISHRTVPLDGNPYNTTAPNLIYPKVLDKTAKSNYQRFKERTVAYMMQKDKKLLAKGLSPIMYWGLQKVLHPFRNEYSKATGYNLNLDNYGIPKMSNEEPPAPKPKKEKKKRNYRTKEELAELRDEVQSLVSDGMPKVDIGKKLGLKPAEVAYLSRSQNFEYKNSK